MDGVATTVPWLVPVAVVGIVLVFLAVVATLMERAK